MKKAEVIWSSQQPTYVVETIKKVKISTLPNDKSSLSVNASNAFLQRVIWEHSKHFMDSRLAKVGLRTCRCIIKIEMLVCSVVVSVSIFLLAFLTVNLSYGWSTPTRRNEAAWVT